MVILPQKAPVHRQEPFVSRQDLHNETLALLRARYVARWLERDGLTLRGLTAEESEYLFNRANAVDKRVVRRFGGAR